MDRLSRPMQIALVAMLLLALVWVVALRAHTSSSSAPTSAPTSASTSVPTPAAVAPKVAEAGDARKPAGLGVSAHNTTAHNTTAHAPAVRPRERVVVRRNTTSRARRRVVGVHKTLARSHTTVVVVHKSAPARHEPAVRPGRAGGDGGGLPASRSSASAPEQAVVERELALGKTVLLVFWNPLTAVDREVRSQASALAAGSKGTVVVHVALAGQVGLFGTITEVAHVYQTPTILIVNRHGVVSTITGLTDVFALQQAVGEAQLAS